MLSPHNHSLPPHLPPLSYHGSAQALGASSPAASPESCVHYTLPSRRVNADTIEDAYVCFIFYCNPALPPSCETTCLRESFRNPPRSGGKSFNTYIIFELVQKFYSGEIRTWTELTTRLGVEPPDPTKEESAQKVAQYGVRLKKWMNSLHVKAFFEYLMDIPNDYWTAVPTDPNPIGQASRDGVAVEDDMALRALLPHIRPKRGRKRPVEDDALTPPGGQRAYSSSVSSIGHPRKESYPPMTANPSRASMNSHWTPPEGLPNTPLPRWPQSAGTPTGRNSFWDDALEAQPAAAPSKPKNTTQRRGPKNVSSAWGVPNGGAKPRGRPPMSRSPMDAPLPPYPSTSSAASPADSVLSAYSDPMPPSSAPTSTTNRGAMPSYSMQSPATAPTPCDTPSSQSSPPRFERPHAPLQPPERPAQVTRLTTPPPAAMPKDEGGDRSERQEPPVSRKPEPPNDRKEFSEAATEAAIPSQVLPPHCPKEVPPFYFERAEDRTNVEEVIGYMVQSTLEADWFDANDKPAPGGTVAEGTAIINTIIEEMFKTSASPQAFLINLAAIVGGRYLVASRTRIWRHEVTDGARRYVCEWEYGFGSIRGLYKMEQKVSLAMMGEKEEEDDASAQKDIEKAREDAASLTEREWQMKYEHLLGEMLRKDHQYLELEVRVAKALKKDIPRGSGSSGGGDDEATGGKADGNGNGDGGGEGEGEGEGDGK